MPALRRKIIRPDIDAAPRSIYVYPEDLNCESLSSIMQLVWIIGVVSPCTFRCGTFCYNFEVDLHPRLIRLNRERVQAYSCLCVCTAVRIIPYQLSVALTAA